MGAGHSAESAPPTLEQLSHALAQRFASKCYTPIEIYCFTAVFNSLADSQSGVKHWSETTLCRFLELPDALGVGPVVFQMASYLGAFPFPSHAPAILTQEALLKVVTIVTERYGAALKKKGRHMWLREMYRSLAVYDRVNSPVAQQAGSNPFSPAAGSGSGTDATIESRLSSNRGFAIDAAADAADEDGSGDDEDDELVLAALDSMDVMDVFKQGEQSNVHHSIIPSDNFLRLIELLLLVAAIEPQQSISSFVAQLSEDRVEQLRSIANKILLSFAVEKYHGVSYKTFTTVTNATLPYLFDGLGPLFEHFLFAKDLDLSKRKNQPDLDNSATRPTIPSAPSTDHVPQPEPILRTSGEIMNMDVLSQLSFFMKGTELFRRLRPLYLGNDAGFSMGSFQKSVFKWQAPSILLVSGTLISSDPSTARERALHDSLPPNRLPDSLSVSPHLPKDTTFTFGAYIPVPWKHSPKQCFGDSQTTLFQLSPMHDVFKASRVSTDYIYFNKPPSSPSGVGFGSAVSQTQYRSSISSSSSSSTALSLGSVSLHLDDALEFGVFTHMSGGGGSFLPSQLPCRRNKNWQDRFEIESLEVWGCGGDEQAEAQRKAWAWEEREAEARRRINFGTGDLDADRELMKMAGLVGGDRSGGSV